MDEVEVVGGGGAWQEWDKSMDGADRGVGRGGRGGGGW